jgi:hypothetical protein
MQSDVSVSEEQIACVQSDVFVLNGHFAHAQNALP